MDNPISILDPRHSLAARLMWLMIGLAFTFSIAAAVYVTLTALATLGLGEHYLVDLIVAVPFTLLIEAICAFRRDRKTALGAGAVGLALTLSWLLLLRTPLVGQLPIWACWTMAVGTIAITVPLQFALRRRLRVTRQPVARMAPSEHPSEAVVTAQ